MWVEPASVPRVVAGDIDDDQVIAAAVSARADLIASGDRKHLLPLGSHQGHPRRRCSRGAQAHLQPLMRTNMTVHELAISPLVLWEEQRLQMGVVGEET